MRINIIKSIVWLLMPEFVALHDDIVKISGKVIFQE